MISRSAVVQGILNLFENPAYLEIGVDSGETFREVRAGYKVAVDPVFKFQPPANTPSILYHPVTSDEYFGALCPNDVYFDVVYVDGLHTFEQTTRDLMNALLRLTPNGIVILDDVLPVSYHAALPSLEDAFRVRDHLIPNPANGQVDNTWMGDVYKLVFFIHTFMQQASYATVLENHGQLVLWRNPRPVAALGDLSVLDVGLLGFADTVLNREVFNIRPFTDILQDIAATRTPHAAGQLRQVG